MQLSGSSKIYSAQEVPDRPVALVFGAGLTASGKPSPYLAARLDTAHELFSTGKVRVILVSGDNSRESHNEPAAMRDYLVAQGVPEDAIVLDYAGFDTHDSCARAHDVFGVDAAVLVTQDYHLPRAVFSCAEAGIDAVGVGAPAIGGPILEYKAREGAASLKAAVDAVFGRAPTYTGARETGVDEALARR